MAINLASWKIAHLFRGDFPIQTFISWISQLAHPPWSKWGHRNPSLKHSTYSTYHPPNLNKP